VIKKVAAMTKEVFQRLATSGFKFNLFLLKSLPGAWFFGIRIAALSTERALVRLPYAWSSKNPFKSTYFAAQMAAGEMSTGILLMYHMQERGPISMLVTSVESAFYKKVSETLYFECAQGADVQTLLNQIEQQDAGEVIVLNTIGKLPNGDIACTMAVTWSVRRKARRDS
jgi:hypothetical protein